MFRITSSLNLILHYDDGDVFESCFCSVSLYEFCVLKSSSELLDSLIKSECRLFLLLFDVLVESLDDFELKSLYFDEKSLFLDVRVLFFFSFFVKSDFICEERAPKLLL